MPSTGNEGNDRVMLAFYDDKVERITIAIAVGASGATGLLGKQSSQRIEL